MKKYATSLCFTKSLDNGQLNIGMSCSIIEAENENEAFGIAYDNRGDMFKSHQLHKKVILEIK